MVEKYRGNAYLRRIMVVLGLLFAGIVMFWFVALTPADRHLLSQSPRQMSIGDTQRSYREYVPDELQAGGALVVSFHGLGSNSWQQIYFSGLHNTTNRQTVVVYPDASKSNQSGVAPGWNSDYCCGSGWVNNVDDVAFIAELIDELSAKYQLDSSRVFVTGFSAGAMFAMKVAEALPDKIAGVASVAGSAGANGEQRTPAQPVPALIMHGQQDTTVPFGGGAGGTDADFNWLSFEQTLDVWRQTNGCERGTSTENSTVIETTYDSCEVATKGIVYKQAAHQWPDWRLFNVWHRQPDASRVISQFFDVD